MNNRGFTLIELLAVITIMGILMIVAIPSVTRIIENSRKDNFVVMAQNYVEGAKTMWASDNLQCGEYVSSAVATGFYYIEVDSNSTSVPQLLESGGSSAWGNRGVKGYILVEVYDDVAPGQDGILNSDLDGNGIVEGQEHYINSGSISTDDVITRKVEFYPVLTDDIHGINVASGGPLMDPDDGLKSGNSLVRGDVVMSGMTYDKSGWNTDGSSMITIPVGFVEDPFDEDCDNDYGYRPVTDVTIKCIEV